jgi:glyoxylase-like metal-dependent hydrolase (beta-lactamase superfamily II)
MKTSLQLLQAGYCTQQEWIAIKGGRQKKIKFPATVGLIHHKDRGVILFDTGYSLRNYTETKGFALTTFAKLLPVYVTAKDTVVAQLEKLGIFPDEVKYIIVSHFHSDHVGGLKDFPKASFITLAESYEYTSKLSPFKAATKGIIQSLIPEDFEKRTTFLNKLSDEFNNYSLPPFPVAHDLWGDGSIIIVPLEGHFRGQFGIVLDCGCFLIADACWLKESYQQNIMPHWLAYRLMDDKVAFRENLNLIYKFHKSNPDIKIIPTHETNPL